jgi:hypothetical protein
MMKYRTQLLLALLAISSAVIGGCSSKPLTPPQAAPAVEVLVPVAVPCKVAQVAPSRLPTSVAAIPVDIYEAAKLILADRAVLKADTTRMAAANSDPCPVAK